MKNSGQAWCYQKGADVDRLGEALAPWYVGWYEPDGRRKAKNVGAGRDGKRAADKLKLRLTSELMTGTYHKNLDTLWDDFVTEYTRRELDGLAVESKRCALDSLTHFKRHMKPVKVFSIDTGIIDEFICRRRKDPGKKKGAAVSPATINKDLRHLKAALTKAVDWGHLQKVPRFGMERTVKKLIRFVTAEHFADIYRACDQAIKPAAMPYPAADWWRGLLTFAYMTGWRISDMLALRRADLDLRGGYAITRGEDNKGGRDDRVKLHAVVVAHMEKLASLDAFVFPWPHDRRTLELEWDRIQGAAGIRLECPGRHEHTEACHLYGFHDLRRAFATVNAPRLTADALQQLMRHRSYLTTQVYINMSRQIDDAVDVLHVPDFLKERKA